MTIKLESIELPEEALLYPANFIKKLGGKEKAKEALLDVIDRYFTTEYIDWEGLKE